MWKTRHFLVGIILGIILGWMFGFLRLPYFEESYSFVFGFLFCAALVAIIAYGWWLRGQKKSSSFSFTRKQLKKDTNSYFIWLVFPGFLLLSFLILSFLVSRNYKLSKNMLSEQRKNNLWESELVLAERKSNSILLMNDLFSKIDIELSRSAERKLSEETVQRLVTLNNSFKPFRFVEGENSTEYFLSPERGQLLLMLCTLDIDSISFAKLKSQISFESADLRNVKLRNADLSGVNLTKSNLSYSQLSGVNMFNGLLSNVNLEFTNLSNSNLEQINLENSKMAWVNLDSSSLISATVSGSDLTNSKMRNCFIQDSDFRWSDMSYAHLNGSIIQDATWDLVDFYKASLINCDFKGTSLIGANLRNTNLQDCNLKHTDLRTVKTGLLDWLEQLEKWDVRGREEIQNNYIVESDPKAYHFMRLITKK